MEKAIRGKSEAVKKAAAGVIVEILERNYVGRQNAVKRGVVRSLLSYRGYTMGDSVMRDAIHRYQPRICMCPKGYYIPAGPADMRAAVEYMDSQIRGMAIRRRQMQDAFSEVQFSQLVLEFI
jgi:hypothetical protein